ncbi:MAG: hypothetical protein A2133_09315 [Actinobacteria bacterium RBG_16_64_13]|nr:MAG: hypothetical protein A2133_09315 [Actinobacteria bacterium RBG_16_64_13]
MNGRKSERRALMFCLLLLLLVALTVVAGCGSDPSGDTTTTTASTASSASTTTTAPIRLSKWDKELAKTASLQAELVELLVEEKAPGDDPRMGIVYGLRARTVAIACRQAIDRNDSALADSAMLQVHYTLNESRDIATGAVEQTLAKARAIVDDLGAPSAQPTEAAALLDELITTLAPMLDAANAVFSTTTTVGPTTTTT